MNRRVKVVVALGALGAVVAGTIGAVRLSAPNDDKAGSTTAVRTAVVERGSLAAGMRLTGTLTRGQLTPLSGSGDGVLTALPAPGAQISAGQELYEVDGRPVFLLDGGTPLWRALKLGDTGKDVLALKASLAALAVLGYRTISYWLPTLPGAVAYLRLRRSAGSSAPKPG